MSRISAVVALLFLLPALAGCMGGETSNTATKWRNELAAHGPVGTPATMEGTLGSGTATLTGTGTVAFRAPAALAVRPTMPGDPPLLFMLATVPGHGDGLLVFRGSNLVLDSGRIEGAQVAAATLAHSNVFSLEPSGGASAAMQPLPEGYEAEQRAIDMSPLSGLRGEGIIVNGSSATTFFQNENAQELATIPPFAATAWGWGRASTVAVNSATFTMDRFALAGESLSGTLDTPALGAIALPQGVFGNNAEIVMTRGAIATPAPFALTQARDAEGWLLQAVVEFHLETKTVPVAAGETAWHKIEYREAGYLGAGLLQSVEVSGPGATMLAVPLDDPPLHIEKLWSTLQDVPWFAQPFAALAFVLASPAVLFADALEGIGCLFATCPHRHPYPVWMEPGEIGAFYVKIEAAQGAGEYPVTVSFTGANYAATSFDLLLVVE